MDCERWLSSVLRGQKFVECQSVREAAKKEGYTKGQLSKARMLLGVVAVNDASLHSGKAEKWFWLIPKEEE